MLQKLKNLIEGGGDIEFSVHGKLYTILPWTDDGIVIGPQGSDDDKVFDDAESLLNGFLIDGVPLADVIDQVFITFSS